MKFEYIPKKKAHEFFGLIDFSDEFYRFIDEFDIEGVKWSQPTTISASYFLRLLRDGSSARARGYGNGNTKENDEVSTQMMEYYHSLLDHGALWKQRNGNVICTAMPYGNKESISENFLEWLTHSIFQKQ